MGLPSLTPAYVIAALATIIGLFVSQGLVKNTTGRLVDGLAAVLVPVAFALAHSIFHSRVSAARIAANSQKTTP